MVSFSLVKHGRPLPMHFIYELHFLYCNIDLYSFRLKCTSFSYILRLQADIAAVTWYVYSNFPQMIIFKFGVFEDIASCVSHSPS